MKDLKSQERVLISTIMKKPYRINLVLDILLPEHFLDEKCGIAYKVIADAYISNKKVDSWLISEILADNNSFTEESSAKIRKWLMYDNEEALELKEIATGIVNRHMARGLKKICQKTTQEVSALAQSSDIWQLVGKLQKKVQNLESPHSSSTVEISEAAEEAINYEQDKTNVIKTGIKDLDDLLGDLDTGSVVVVGARPSMGKTSLAVNIGCNIAKSHKNSVAVFSLEMSTRQIMMRILSSEARIPLSVLRSGKVESRLLTKTVEKFKSWKMLIDDTSKWTTASLRHKVTHMNRTTPLSCIIIDYLQLLSGSNGNKQEKNFQVAEIMQDIKALAKDLQVTIILLSQISRAVESRDIKIPKLCDLKESGSIEQDADIVMFLYREAYYLKDLKPQEDSYRFTEWQRKYVACMKESDIIVAKNRNGAVGSFKCTFEPEYCFFHQKD